MEAESAHTKADILQRMLLKEFKEMFPEKTHQVSSDHQAEDLRQGHVQQGPQQEQQGGLRLSRQEVRNQAELQHQDGRL